MAVARAMGLARGTVRKFARTERFPACLPHGPGPSILDPLARPRGDDQGRALGRRPEAEAGVVRVESGAAGRDGFRRGCRIAAVHPEYAALEPAPVAVGELDRELGRALPAEARNRRTLPDRGGDARFELACERAQIRLTPDEGLVATPRHDVGPWQATGLRHFVEGHRRQVGLGLGDLGRIARARCGGLKHGDARRAAPGRQGIVVAAGKLVARISTRRRLIHNRRACISRLREPHSRAAHRDCDRNDMSLSSDT